MSNVFKETASVWLFLSLCFAFLIIYNMNSKLIQAIKWGDSRPEKAAYVYAIIGLMMFAFGGIYFLKIKPKEKRMIDTIRESAKEK